MNLFLTLSCRSRQALNSIKTALEKKTDSTLHVGAGCVSTAGELLRRQRVKKPLVLLPAGESPGREALLQSLEEAELPFVLWEVNAAMSRRDMENIRLYYIGANCDSFVALGGDDILSGAKLAAARVVHGKKTAGELSGKTLRRKTPRILAIPTGLETRVLAPRLQLEDGLTLKGERLRPSAVLLDRELLPGTDRETLAALCLRLFGLAVEGLLDKSNKDRQNALRLSAAAMLGQLERLAEEDAEPGDELFREAAWLGGQRGGYALALAEEAGRVLQIHPGAALAPILPALLELYAQKAPKAMEALEALAGDFGLYTREEPTPEEEPSLDGEPEAVTPPPADLLWQIRNLAWRCGLPEQLPRMDDGDLHAVAAAAAAAVNPQIACPLVLGPKDLTALLRKVGGQG